MKKIWEDYISLNSSQEPDFEVLASAKEYFNPDVGTKDWYSLDFECALEKDIYPLPLTEDREGYYGGNHFAYWASGLQDAEMLLDTALQLDVQPKSVLDLGCASGRVIRHFAVQYPAIDTYGCDINRLHVEWCSRYLPDNLVIFQNHSIPSIPMPDSSLDLVSAFSVFTHIEALETAWLMEIRRVLKPGGIAWVTVHTDDTLREMNENWPLWNPTMNHPESSKLVGDNREFKGDRLVLRWQGDRSYTSNVFYKRSYLEDTWGRILNVVDVRRRCPRFQDVVVFQKTPARV